MKTQITLLTLAAVALSALAADFQHWKKGLYHFAQLIFKPTNE